MDIDTFSSVMGGKLRRARYAELLPHYLGAMKAANITTPARAAMFAAQIGHESDGLVYMEEIADGAVYEGRADLGNTHPGDGRRFKGSGPIQLTGRANFRAFTRWVNAAGYTSIDFEAEPHLVRKNPKWGFLAAAWYWSQARPQLNALADRGDIEGCTRAINGGLNGLADRRLRYQRALAYGARLITGEEPMEKVLEFVESDLGQDTGYNCGPASVQTVVRAATGVLHSEATLAPQLGTHRGGTDWIGQFPRVLNRYLVGANFQHAEMPNDPPTMGQAEKLWQDVTTSINHGFGVVANIVSPPSNRPRAVAPSTQSPNYGAGTVYHYVAIMGYSTHGGRRYLVADSGFDVKVYWIAHDQMATLIPPKGYAFATNKPDTTTPASRGGEEGAFLMSLSHEEQVELLQKTRTIHHELTHGFQSRYPGSEHRETLVGYVLEMDRKIEDMHANMIPAIYGLLKSVGAKVLGGVTEVIGGGKHAK